MKAKSNTTRYTIVEANTNDHGLITGYRAKPDPDLWDLLEAEAAEYLKTGLNLLAILITFALACLIFG